CVCVPLSLSLSSTPELVKFQLPPSCLLPILSLSHTHTHTHTHHTHTHAHTRRHTQTHTHTRANLHASAFTHIQSHADILDAHLSSDAPNSVNRLTAGGSDTHDPRAPLQLRGEVACACVRRR